MREKLYDSQQKKLMTLMYKYVFYIKRIKWHLNNNPLYNFVKKQKSIKNNYKN